MKYLRIIKATMGALSSSFYMIRQFISLYRMIDVKGSEENLVDDLIDTKLKESNQWMSNAGIPALEAMIAAEETKGVSDKAIEELLEDLKIKSD